MMLKKLLPLVLLRGALGALGFIAFFLLVYALSPNPFLPSIKSYDFFIYAFWLFIVMVHYRFRANAGKLVYGEGLVLALGTSFLMISFSTLFLYGFLHGVDPKLSQTYGAYEISQFEGAREQWIEEFERTGNNGTEIYEQTLSNYHKRNWNSYLIKQEFWQKAFIAFLMSLILPLILRKS